jgi:hypothetical protein
MSNKERIGVILDVSADVGKIEGSLSSLRNHLSGIQLPKGIGKELETRMSRLSDEIKNFQNLASKAGDSFEGVK